MYYDTMACDEGFQEDAHGVIIIIVMRAKSALFSQSAAVSHCEGAFVHVLPRALTSS